MEAFIFNNITAAAPTTSVLRRGQGILHSITINKAAINGVITVYDGIDATGTLIGTITSPATLLANQNTLIYDVCFNKGLTIVTSTTAQDITVSYK
jgi:hypothetical protein